MKDYSFEDITDYVFGRADDDTKAAIEKALDAKDSTVMNMVREAGFYMQAARDVFDHPDDNTMAAYIDGVLEDGPERRLLEMHLEYCEECRQVVQEARDFLQDEQPPASAATEGQSAGILSLLKSLLEVLLAPPLRIPAAPAQAWARDSFDFDRATAQFEKFLDAWVEPENREPLRRYLDERAEKASDQTYGFLEILYDRVDTLPPETDSAQVKREINEIIRKKLA